MTYVSARERVLNLFDEFEDAPLQTDADTPDPIAFPGYLEAQKRVRESRGPQDSDEAVLIGIGTLDSIRCVAAVFDFGFFGGSMGVAAGRRLESAMGLALQMRLPFVALTTSGGARMQEGMAALAQMPRTVAASVDLAGEGVPRIAVLGDPTTGGVYSSFAAISDVVVAESEATIGFAGPRIAAAIADGGLPLGSHTAEMAFESGLVDAVVESAELRGALIRLLRILQPMGKSGPQSAPKSGPNQARTVTNHTQHTPRDAWSEFELARHPDRPSPRLYIETLCPERFELHGDRQGSDDEATVATLALFEGRPVVFVAFNRRRPTAAGFRKAARAIRLASRLGLTIV
ncbi:MAG: carboxyl transferase domain-containing protein, partial [Acidimicrobiia bacterium]